MRYWDTSALVPLLHEESMTAPMQEQLRKDSIIVTWWGTEIECASAVARLEREGLVDFETAGSALRRLKELSAAWNEVLAVRAIKETSKRLVRMHALRAADSLQLAAALLATDHQPSAFPFLCLDQLLSQAAEREGFSVAG